MSVLLYGLHFQWKKEDKTTIENFAKKCLSNNSQPIETIIFAKFIIFIPSCHSMAHQQTFKIASCPSNNL